MTLRFDDSLPALMNAIVDQFGPEAANKSVILRDNTGTLSAAVPVEIDGERASAASAAIADVLQGYARPDRVLVLPGNYGFERLYKEGSRQPPIRIGDVHAKLLDRRIIGADWLQGPQATYTKIPRIVFSSLKGGVGRSTALCILAAYFSISGYRVLTVDLDLEAPGIGTMLLKPSELPEFGTLDYLLENGITGIDDNFMNNVHSNSYLGSAGARVAVAPAIGTKTLNNPGNALSKLARVYLEDINEQNVPKPFRLQVREMIEQLTSRNEFDVVLIDSRAGLHESSAASLLELGAEVLLFGTDQPQTYQGYDLLVSYLANFSVDEKDDWRERIRFVHAKATENTAGADQEFNLLQKKLYSLEEAARTQPSDLGENDFSLDWDDATEEDLSPFEPPAIIHIRDDENYRNFNPIINASQLQSHFYSDTYKELLMFADEVIENYGMSK